MYEQIKDKIHHLFVLLLSIAVLFSVAIPNISLSDIDNQAPSVPSGLTVYKISPTQNDLSWTASTDNVGVTGYKIFRNGSQVGTATETRYRDSGLTGNTSYGYTVSAYNA